jgi:hypothetical protein
LQLLDVSPAGEALVFALSLAGAFNADESIPLYSLIDLATGRERPFTLPEGDEGYRISRVGLSPDGAYALYTVSLEDRLVLLDLETGEGRDLFAGLPADERPHTVGFRLDWAENDLVYVSASPNEGALLQLGAA